MKRKIIFLGALCISALAFSQVGINNIDPKATLDVTAKTTDGSKPEGMIAPRLTGDQIKQGDSQYTLAQAGALIYATSAVTTASTKTANITAAGYYYFDGSLWQKVGLGSTTGVDTTDDAFINDPANVMVKVGTNADGSTARSAGTEFVIKDNGNIGVGTDSPTNKIDVANGQIRVGTDTSNQSIIGQGYADFYNSGNRIANVATNGTNYLRISEFGNHTVINPNGGNVGVGFGSSTSDMPTAKLHIRVGTAATGFRLEDTSQAAGKVLTSDTNGNGIWSAGGTGASGIDGTNDEWSMIQLTIL